MLDLFVRALPLLEKAVLVTLGLGFFCVHVLAARSGLLVALARISPYRPLRWFGFCYVSVFRGTPLLIQLLLIYYGLPSYGIVMGPIAVRPARPNAVRRGLPERELPLRHFRRRQRAVGGGMVDGHGLLENHAARGSSASGPHCVAPMGSRLVGLMKDTSLASTVTVIGTDPRSRADRCDDLSLPRDVRLGGRYLLVHQPGTNHPANMARIPTLEALPMTTDIADPIIRVTGLQKQFGDNVVLRDITLDVPKGQVLVVMGPPALERPHLSAPQLPGNAGRRSDRGLRRRLDGVGRPPGRGQRGGRSSRSGCRLQWSSSRSTSSHT